MRGRVRVGLIIRRSLSFAAALLLMFSAFIPVAALSMKAQFKDGQSEKNVTCSMDNKIYTMLQLTDEQIEQFEDANRSSVLTLNERLFKEIATYYTASQVKNGKSMGMMASVVMNALCGFGGASYGWVFSLISVIAVLITVVATLSMWQTTAAICTGCRPLGGVVIPARVVGILFSAIAMTLVIILSRVATHNFHDLYSASVSLGAGTFFWLISSVALCSIPVASRLPGLTVEDVETAECEE